MKVAPREPGTVSQSPNKTVRGPESARFSPRERLLRERVLHSYGPTRGNKGFVSLLPVGGLFFSISAQAGYRSPPSNPKASTPV